jgi:hypothetical protein
MKMFHEVHFDSPPVMLAAWQGMGNVGLIAMDYLRSTMGAQKFAEIDMSPYFIPDSIVVKNGIAQFPDIPSSAFYYTQHPNIIIFVSNAQVGGKEGISVVKNLLDIARQFNVTTVFTAAAFARPMSHVEESSVMNACNSVQLLSHMRSLGVEPMPDGYIAGLNGLLLGVAGSRGMDAACLLGSIPSYATNFSYPKASLAIMQVLEKACGVEVDMNELLHAVEEMDERLDSIEERIKEFFPSVQQQHEELSDMDQDQVPQYIMDKIERLFDQVKKDRTRARELKEELDRWNLYELYEKRFLDLFKDDDDSNVT